MEIGTFRGLLTALLLLLFLGIWAWSWSRKRKVDFERAANLPLEDDTRPPPQNTNKEQST
jgi:cytochrome c oxidase cbb3-type subunit 4